MTARFSLSVQKDLEKIYQKEKKLSERIEKQIALFAEDPHHPSLRTHKLTGKMDNMWSISISRSIRMVYVLIDENSALFVKIGTHDQVYAG